MENIIVEFPKTTDQSKLNEETKLLLKNANLFVNQENILNHNISFVSLNGTYNSDKKQLYLLGVLINRTYRTFKEISFELGVVIKNHFKSDVIRFDFPSEFVGELPRNYGILTGFHIGINLPENELKNDLIVPSSEITTYFKLLI